MQPNTKEYLSTYLYIFRDSIAHPIDTRFAPRIECNTAYQGLRSTFPYREPCGRWSQPITTPDVLPHRA